MLYIYILLIVNGTMYWKYIQHFFCVNKLYVLSDYLYIYIHLYFKDFDHTKLILFKRI